MNINEEEMIVVAFERYKKKLSRQMTEGGEGKRVPQIIAQMSFEDFRQGWRAAREVDSE